MNTKREFYSKFSRLTKKNKKEVIINKAEDRIEMLQPDFLINSFLNLEEEEKIS